MITLITGVPGGGKTLYAVHEFLRIANLENEKALSEGRPARPIYVDGIPELLIPHETAPDILDWPTWAPDGSLIVVDEVQRIWRPEASTKALPISISALETHRHRGLDFIIITQHPNLMHVNVRKLVGRYIHLRRTAVGVYAYEWSECVNPDSAWKSALSKNRWGHPKSSFGLYKSASVHQKVKFRIPRPVMVIGFGVLVLGILGYRLYNSATGRNHPVVTAELPATTQQVAPVGSVPQKAQSAADKRDDIESETRQLIIKDPVKAFTPRFVAMPESAPAYDAIRVVKSMPRLAGCIASEDDCRCYTEQGTDVAIPPNECRQTLKKMAYNAYRDNALAGAVSDVSLASR